MGYKFTLFILIIILNLPVHSSLSPKIIAKVGNTKILLKDFKRHYSTHKKGSKVLKPEIYLDNLIKYELGLLEAKKQNLQEDPYIKEKFRKLMFSEMIKRNVTKKTNKIRVSDKEMRAFYKSNPEVRVSHIFLSLPRIAKKTQIKEVRSRANVILKKVKKNPASFKDLVKLYTEEKSTKSKGGDLGYQSVVSLNPKLYNVAKKMSVGDISGLMQTKYGFHIIKLSGVKKYNKANKRPLRALVFERKRQAFYENYFQTLQSKYKVQKNKSLVKTLK
jgi:parvulin-like peptidyl-prolyl isomerase